MRYPVVWEMTAPARANEPAHPAAALPPEKPEHLAPAAPPQAVPPPVVRSEIKPIPEPAETNGRDNPLPPEVQSLPPAAATPDAATAATRPETQKPLVPVTTVSAPTMPNGGAAGRRACSSPPLSGADRFRLRNPGIRTRR